MAKGFTVWLTGLSGAGKSTIAEALAVELKRRGIAHEVVDGDVIRTTLSKGLGFSREDRDTNIARIALICALLSKHGIAAISAAISPYAAARNAARHQIENFVEVHVECRMDVLKARDTKGLYAKAERGEIQHFTGISDPYEPPIDPEIIVRTDMQDVAASVAEVVRYLEEAALIAPVSLASVTPRLRSGSLTSLVFPREAQGDDGPAQEGNRG
jgi:adenylylsulfate kinase